MKTPPSDPLASRWSQVVHDQHEKAGTDRLQSERRGKRSRDAADSTQTPRPSAHRRYTPVVRGHLPLDGAVTEGARVDACRSASAQSAEEGLHGGQRVASRGRWTRECLPRDSPSTPQSSAAPAIRVTGV